MELLTFINTTLDLDQNFLNGFSPYLFISANVTIDHFNARNRGFYSCATNIHSKSSQRTLVTTSECIIIQLHYRAFIEQRFLIECDTLVSLVINYKQIEYFKVIVYGLKDIAD